MAAKRRTWNNIIIFACILMVSLLTVFDKLMNAMPDDAVPFFDEATPLTSIQLDGLSLERSQGLFVCDKEVTNCDDWGKAWLELHISPVTEEPAEPSDPRELVIRIGALEPQVWLMFADGLLKSPHERWYLVPPSLRQALEPKLAADSK